MTLAPEPQSKTTGASDHPHLPAASFGSRGDWSPFDKTPPALQIPTGVSLLDHLTNKDVSSGAMRLVWKNESERSEALVFQFAQLGVPKQVFRWTGWAGRIGEREKDLITLYDAFKDINGFHIFGGTQVRRLTDGSLIPSTGDVPIALKKYAVQNNNPHFVLIGIIPKVSEEPRYLPGLGLVLRVQQEVESGKQAEYVTVINFDQNMGVVLQPDVNGKYEWIDEIKESLRQCKRLAEKGWSTNLIVFGGSVTPENSPKLRNVEQELVWWAELANRNTNENINILLIKGSGGVADKYAFNHLWLTEHPHVKVADLNIDSIRAELSVMRGLQP